MESTATISDSQLKLMLNKLRNDIENNSNGTGSLAQELESAVKHLPTYIRIVKKHIEQLKNVLALPAHQNKSMDSIELAEPVRQIINLFNILQENDIKKLEELSMYSKNWNDELTNEEGSEVKVETALTEHS